MSKFKKKLQNSKDKQLLIELKEQANRGILRAQEDLAWYYDQHKQYKKSFCWYNVAAKKTQNPIIFYNLSLCYLLGTGTEKNEQKAFYWTKKAADKKYLDGIIALAWHYLNGVGVEVDYNFAIKYYKEALKIENNPASLFSLGQRYYEQKEYANAIFYLEKAIKDFKHPKACYILGRIYFEGKGVEINFNKAKKLLTTAMNGNIYNAKRLLNSKKFRTLL